MHGRLALLLIAAACSKRANEQQPSTTTTDTPRLYTAAELATYEKALLARLAETATRTCVRPIVREPGVDTPAAPDLVELVEPTGPLTACGPALAKIVASGASAKAGDLVEARDPAVVALAGTCGPLLEEAVRKASAHRDACSPFQLGVRKEPETWMNVIYSAHLLGLHARLSAERGTPTAALWMLINGAAAFRDLGRGRVGLIGAMIAVASTDTLLEQARAILTTAKLAPADLEALIAGVDGLLASEQPFADTLAGEREYFELYLAMPQLKGKDWVPPGGWSLNAPRPAPDAVSPFGAMPITKHPHDEAGMMFETATVMAKAREQACPATATLAACHKGLTTLGDTTKAIDPKAAAERLWSDLMTAVGSGDVIASARRIRAELVAILSGVAHPAFTKYSGKRAGGLARIAALRIHLEILRKGMCPTEAELADSPYPNLRAPVALGDVVDIVPRANGDLDVSPPVWTESKKPPWRIACKPR